MTKRTVLKGILALAVIGICGIGIIQLQRGLLFSGRQQQNPESSDGPVPTSGPSSQQESPAVTGSPRPGGREKIKKHREGKSVWTYHTQTKCLVISGKGQISVHGNDDTFWDIDPGYYHWDKPSYRPPYAEKVKKIIIKPGITYINEGVFYEYRSLETVVLGDTVKELGGYAFWQCGSLNKIIMGKNIKKIGTEAFYGCSSLETISIGKRVEEIGSQAFCGCSSLQKISLNRRNTNFSLESGLLYNRQKTVLFLCPAKKENIPIRKDIKEIAPAAFAYCGGLKKITIPSAVEKLEDKVFFQCKNLQKVTFSPKSNCHFIGTNVFSDCVRLQEFVLPDSVKYMGDVLTRCKSLQRVYLGSSFAGFTSADTWEEAERQETEKTGHELSRRSFSSGVTHGSIKEYQVSESNPWFSSQDGVLYNKDKTRLFCYPQGKKTKTVKVPDSVQVIKGMAFYCNRNIEEVILSKSLQTIGGNAFSWSKNLKSVKIAGKNVVIRSYAFSCCQSLSQVKLGNGVREIKSGAFYDTKFKEIHIPPSVKKIGREALGMTRGIPRDVIGFTIYGKKGSAAERYAKKHVFDFVAE